MASNARNRRCRITRATTRANAPDIGAKCVVATNTRASAMTSLSRVKTTARCSIHAARITTVDRPDGPRATVTVRGPALRPTALLPRRQRGPSCSLRQRWRCSPARVSRCASLAQIEIKRRVTLVCRHRQAGMGCGSAPATMRQNRTPHPAPTRICRCRSVGSSRTRRFETHPPRIAATMRTVLIS